MKKLILMVAFILGVFSSRSARAVNVNDIDAIKAGWGLILEEAVQGNYFATQLVELRDASFQYNIIGSTEVVSITNQQKQGLLSKYKIHLQKIKDLVNALPE